MDGHCTRPSRGHVETDRHHPGGSTSTNGCSCAGILGLALRHLAMTTEDQGLFKGVVAVPTGEREREREPVDDSCRSDEVFV